MISGTQKFIFLISMTCATVAFLIILQTFHNLQKTPDAVRILKATRDLKIGETLTEADVRLAPALLSENIQTAYRQSQDVLGHVVRNPVRRNALINESDLANSTDFLLSLIPEGYRAFSIQFDLPPEIVNILGFGTRVDVIFSDKNIEQAVPRVIMENVLVMKAYIEGKKDERSLRAFVTLALPPEAAQTISYASQKGKLDLVIRPHGEKAGNEFYLPISELVRNDVPMVVQQKEIEMIQGIKKSTVKL